METESPRSKYQRYLQSTIDEVSDVDEWTNIHYGFARDSGDELPEGDDDGCPTSRSRPRNSDNVPQPKTMPKPLAKAVARDVAQTVAMDMIEAIENSGPISSTATSSNPAVAGNVNEENYFVSSVPMADFFSINPVPREPLALEDYRWDLLGQGTGPEHILVINCRNLSRSIPTMTDPMIRERHLRLLRNLQNLLIQFQSGKPEEWIEAAERVRDWLNYDGDADYFEEAVTEAGSSIYDDDNEGHEGEEECSDGRSDHSYDYDENDAGDGDRPQEERVADSAGMGGSSSAAG